MATLYRLEDERGKGAYLTHGVSCQGPSPDMEGIKHTRCHVCAVESLDMLIRWFGECYNLEFRFPVAPICIAVFENVAEEHIRRPSPLSGDWNTQVMFLRSHYKPAKRLDPITTFLMHMPEERFNRLFPLVPSWLDIEAIPPIARRPPPKFTPPTYVPCTWTIEEEDLL